MRQALGRARFSVMPSRWYENGPMAGLESLASGIPLVGTSMGGIPEMIVDGQTGLITEAGNPEAMLTALLAAAKMGDREKTAARTWAENNASRPAHMEKLESVLRYAMRKSD